MSTSVQKYTFEQSKSNIYEFPKLAFIITQVELEFKKYKYTVYRCAAKFVSLKKKFFTNNIPYKLVWAVMERHGIIDGDCNLMVPPFQLTSLIHDVYYLSEKMGHYTTLTTYTLENATAVLSNFFWSIYDPRRRHSISLLEIKITFLLLCKLHSSDQMISDIFNLLQNQKTKSIPKLNFEYLLNVLTKIFSYIGEGVAYGAHNTQLVIEHCYARCHNLLGINDYQFYCLWTTAQTPFIIYANLICLIKRIEDTEKLIHLNTCASCHIDKITGIRFKCRSCTDLSLCLKCFASGYSNNKHVVGHKMIEVYTEDTPKKKFADYFVNLCTVFFCNSKNFIEEECKSFCNANDTAINSDTELVIKSIKRNTNASTISTTKEAAEYTVPNLKQRQSPNVAMENIQSSLSCLTKTATNALNVSGKLQIIIDKLLQQNEKLEIQLECVQTSTQQELSVFLNEHHKFLMNIINEMRNFAQQTSPVKMSSHPTSSTPNRADSFSFSTSLSNLSTVLNTQSKNGINRCNLISHKANLTHSINGADINRSYLEANKSDYSLKDLSLWFNQRPPTLNPQPLSVLTEVPSQDEHNYNDNYLFSLHACETEMSHFKLLLNKVKQIVDDSYSDNTELSEATQNLETVVDSIIKTEEVRRNCLD